MHKVIVVKYDLSMDEANYKYSLVDEAYPTYGRNRLNVLPKFSENLYKQISLVKDKNEKIKIIRNYLHKHYSNQPLFDQSVNNLQSSWNLISELYVNRLLEYLQIKNYTPKTVTCYLTTLRLCPYNLQKRYFYVSSFTNLFDQIQIIMHELMHIIFLDNYEGILLKRGLTKQAILDINETLVELLNLEFNDLLVLKVINNKPTTDDLVKILIDKYDNKTNFKDILESLIQARL